MNQDPVSLVEIIKKAIEQRLLEVHTSMPGQIVSYDSSKQIANIQPMIKKIFGNNTSARALPVLPDIPIVFPRTATTFIHLPIKANDYVTIFFSERSIDKFLLSGKLVDPEDARKHSIADAFAIPGLFPTKTPFTVTSPDDIEIVNSSARISMKATGKFQITNGNEELVSLVKDLCTYCEAITTMTALGVQPIINKAQFTALKSKIDNLKG